MAELEEDRKPFNMGGGIILLNPEGKILMGKRATESGYGLWCIPGGKMDPEDENIREAVKRELREEAGIELTDNPRIISIDDRNVKDRKFLNFGILATTKEEPQVVQPEEISEWRWFSREELPADNRIFEPSLVSLQSYKTGKLQVNSPIRK